VKLVKFERSPSKTIKYRGKKFKLDDILKEIALLFYEKGEAVESTTIAKKLGLQKTGKFTEKVIRYHLCGRMVNCESIKGRVFVSPSALILISRDEGVLDLTELEGFHDNLLRFSSKIIVNIIREQVTLEELLLLFEGVEREAVKKLVKLCKIAEPLPQYEEDGIVYYDFAKYDLNTLKGYIHRGFLLEDVSQKTRDSRYKFGNLDYLDFILWYGTGRRGEEFTYNDVVCKYVKAGTRLPDEIREATKEILKKKRRDAEKLGQVFVNHPGYKLLEIKVKRKIKKRKRRQKIYLSFGPTDFNASVRTNQSLDEPILESKEGGCTTIRHKYIRKIDLNEPDYLKNSFLSNMFGVALVTITEDDKIILQRRSRQVLMGPEKLTLATAENMIRGLDEDKDGKPNPFITAKRCIREELGEEIDLRDVLFLGFGVRLDNLLPQALGMVKLRLKSSDIRFVKAKDRWEGRNFLEDFTISNLKKYFEEPYSISDTAKLAILLTLIHELGFEDVERSLSLDVVS
jgi:hypothetical protein